MTLHHAAFDDVFHFSANQLHGCNEEFVLITTHSNFSESALSRSIELAYARTDVTYAMTLCSGDVCDTTKWLIENCSVEVAKEMMTSLRLPVTKYLRHHRSDNRSSVTWFAIPHHWPQRSVGRRPCLFNRRLRARLWFTASWGHLWKVAITSRAVLDYWSRST